MKIYTNFPLTEDEFKRLHGSLVTSRHSCFSKLRAASDTPDPDPKERAFYLNLVNDYDALLERFEKVVDEHAKPDEDEDEEDDEWEKDTGDIPTGSPVTKDDNDD